MVRKSRLMLLLVMLLAAFLVGCQTGQQTTETQQAQGPEGKAAARAKRGKAVAQQEEEKITAPAGTALSVRLNEGINTGTTPAGASIEGSLAAPLVVSGVEVAPVGSLVTGQVTNVVSSGRLNKPAELSLVLTSLTPKGGEKIEISTNTWGTKGESHKKRNIEMIGGGGGAGALIGALAGGKKGALIGGAVGAGAGTGVAAATGKKEIVLAPESKLEFNLNAPATFTVKNQAAQ
jgi:outer membrane lipoprotein SlyB